MKAVVAADHDVAVVRCTDYGSQTCRAALETAIGAVGGIDWVLPGMRIAVKANLVRAMKPEAAATTHPALLCELTKLLTARGASVVIGDSPGGLFNPARMSHVYDVTGLRACEKLGAELNTDCSQKTAQVPEARVAKTIDYTAWLDGVDAIIDFCKLKTHAQMGMSCAVKNMFGAVPGTMKPEYHYRYPDPADFANAIVDIFERFRPRLCLCDAVTGMEGNGPTMGTPRDFGMLLASRSGYELDLLAAELLGYEPAQIPTVEASIKRGLCPESAASLNVFGEPDDFRQDGVERLQAQSTMTQLLGDGNAISRLGNRVVKSLIDPFPKLDPTLCTGCGGCARMCPAKVITMKKGRPRIDRRHCIHCFCCQEFCPQGAMKAGRRAVARLLGGK